MMIPTYMASMWQAIANHLWQSTLFAVIAGLLTLALRKNQARTRYWLWLAASVKFLIPFSLLVGLGSHLARPHILIQTQPGFYFAVDQVSQPFTYAATSAISGTASSTAHLNLTHLLPAILAAIWLCGVLAVLSMWYVRWRRISLLLRDAAPLRTGREVEALRRMEHAVGMRKPVTLLLSQASLEPGIFGIARPVLLWPEGISERLEDAHLEAIVAHELWHVRRRDNLTAAMHMVVEAAFWFHPLVWWLGAQLVAERERACDEEVLQLGNRPQIYAESILKTCRFCVESPLACVSGITGADLKRRILAIMTERIAIRLSFTKKLLLGATGVIAVGVPLMLGLANATQSGAGSQIEGTAVPALTFEVVSIKPNKSSANIVSMQLKPDGLTATGTLQMLVQNAYGVQNSQIAGAPNWLHSEKYDIEAKLDGPAAEEFQKLSMDQRRLETRRMLQSLLADRCQLTVHRETKEFPVYALVVAKNGSELHEAKTGDLYPGGIKDPDGHAGAGMMFMEGNGGPVIGQGVPIATLVRLLSQQLGRTVLDKTGLTGKYDFHLQWTPDEGSRPPGPRLPGPGGAPQEADSPPPVESSGPSIFTAIQEQLGLKLESAKGPVEVLVIDHIERPTPN